MRSRMLIMMFVLAGCAEAVAPDGGGFQREVRGGGLHAAAVEGVRAGAVELDRLLATAAPVAHAVGELGAADFATRVEAEGGLVTVFARQTVGGVPVRGAYLYLAVADGGAAPARLVASSYHLYQGAEATVAPALDRAEAEAAARVALRAGDGAAHAELAIVPDGDALRLVWDVTIAGVHRRALVTARGPELGRIETVDDRVYDADGRVAAWIAAGGAPGGAGIARRVALADTLVSAGSATAYTDAGGGFAVRGGGAAVMAATRGRAADVRSVDGDQLRATGAAGAGLELVLGAAGGSERVLALTTTYYYATRARQVLLAAGVPASALGAPVDAFVDAPDTCNAYFSPSDRALVFFRAGGGCRNSAEASIVIHEYGHFADDAFGGITDFGLSEGWGDVLACMVLGAPEVGGDLFEDGEPLRSCDNDYRYPRHGDDEVHALGQAWAGFVWHAREGLIDALGPEAGDAAIRALVIPVLRSNAPDIPSAVREVFLRDDDDRDLSNRTPHWDILLAAARRHGLDFATERDETAPGPIADLTARADRPTRVTVAWTSTGDDGARGTAARYELRWSTRPITEASFAAATPAQAPVPAAAGTREEAILTVPPVGRVYVAVRARDELGNPSPVATVGAAELPPPHVVFADGAEGGLEGWTATGLWHVTARRAGGGQRAWWYGREASGDYDTGAPSRGTLTSPAIDLAGVAAPRLVWLEDADVENDPAWDRLAIEVIDADDPAVVIAAGKVATAGRGFAARMLDLDGLAGRRVRIRFSIDTGDAIRNDLAGWFVDDVRVIGEPGPMPTGTGRLLINEILADPPTGLDVDGDGAWSARGDEMIELINVGDGPLDLGGATVTDGEAVRATVPAGLVLAPGQVAVITGGAAPMIAGVATAGSAGLYLNNGGDTITIRAATGAVLATATYGGEGGNDQSLTRHVDGDPAAPWVGHRTVSPLPASPGRRADGRPF